MTTLTVHFDFNALAQGLTARVCAVLERAAFVLHAVDSASINPGTMPAGNGPPTISVSLPTRPLADVREDTRLRTLSDALRDCVEEVSRFLEETRRLCAAVCLADEGTVTANRWREAVEVPASSFDRLTFPDKIARLQRDYGATILHDSIEFIATLNKLRNCVVHRHGVVDERDCNDDQSMRIRWQKNELFDRTVGGTESLLTLPHVLNAGDQILARLCDEQKSFRRGERVSVSETDLAGMWYTFQVFAFGTAQRVESFARDRGFVISAPPPPPGHAGV